MASPALPEFHNEPYNDFSTPANRQAMEAALAHVRSQFGHEYDLEIGGERFTSPAKLKSVNPSNPKEIVGIHQKATREMAGRAVTAAYEFFPQWRDTSAAERVHLLLNATAILRRRKMEFDAWLVYEAGKT